MLITYEPAVDNAYFDAYDVEKILKPLQITPIFSKCEPDARLSRVLGDTICAAFQLI
jgi:hypothetical protein